MDAVISKPTHKASQSPTSGRACVLFASTVCLAVAIALGAAPGAHATKTGSCPKNARGALPLSPGAAKKASTAALKAAPRLYKAINVKDAKVISAKVATHAGARGSEVFYHCGKAIQARTIVVQLRFPKMQPSASLSEGVVFVSRFKSGYRVWERAH
ncbi:MAG: hypothetical protein ACYCXW_18350 [Solirubrobacteraceae bacterium]